VWVRWFAHLFLVPLLCQEGWRGGRGFQEAGLSNLGNPYTFEAFYPTVVLPLYLEKGVNSVKRYSSMAADSPTPLGSVKTVCKPGASAAASGQPGQLLTKGRNLRTIAPWLLLGVGRLRDT